jgi:hypothetical protein
MANETGEGQVNGQAFVVMANNTFENNMAYFAGNVFYIRPQITKVEDWIDYRQVCGSGILIESNRFIGNIGLKKHNGGAGVIRCLLVESAEGDSIRG